MTKRIGLQEHLVGRALKRHVPALHHDDAVGLRRLFHEVRDHDDGHAALVQLVAHAHQARAPARIQHGRRLVKHQHRRIHGQHAGNGHALLLSAGQRVRLVALKAGKPHILKRLRHAFAQLRRGDTQVFGAEGHVVFHQRRHQLIVGVLKHHAARFAHRIRALGVGGVHAVYHHTPFVGHQQRVQVLR